MRRHGLTLSRRSVLASTDKSGGVDPDAPTHCERRRLFQPQLPARNSPAVTMSRTGQILKTMEVPAPVTAVSVAMARSIIPETRSTQSVKFWWETQGGVATMTTAAMNHMAIASAIHSRVMTNRLSHEVSLKPLTTRRVGRMWATPHRATTPAATRAGGPYRYYAIVLTDLEKVIPRVDRWSDARTHEPPSERCVPTLLVFRGPSAVVTYGPSGPTSCMALMCLWPTKGREVGQPGPEAFGSLALSVPLSTTSILTRGPSGWCSWPL